ncbi:TPA: preprotein translocase subunit SecA [bacterium]|nr:preprotein translocase subunit SecA [bacterium]
MLKKYQHTIKEINRFDFANYDDNNLLNRFRQLKNQSNSEIFAIIKEAVDRRLGIWKIFDNDLPNHLDIKEIKEIYNIVREKRKLIDDEKIHLDALFYKKVRELRKLNDKLEFMPFDVQLMGGLALLDGKIAEMGTGEGKTVAAIFPACIWALNGKKVHIATVNDYLALRDCIWMSPVYRFFGFEVDCILSYMQDDERRKSYKADIVYGNNYEFGFDYLRDNLKNRLSDRVQGKLEYVIIDEIDSILMDEAATPLIISGAPNDSTSDYWKFKDIIEALIARQKEIVEDLFKEFETENDSEIKIIRLIQIKMADQSNEKLHNYLSNNKDLIKEINAIHGKFIAGRSEYKLEEDLLYILDEKHRTVKLTDLGIKFIEEKLWKDFFTLEFRTNQSFIDGNINVDQRKNEQIRNFLQLLRAYTLYRKDEDYIIINGNVIIVDEFTGRLAFGKKYEEGLHQAIECKEGLQITPENLVTGKITHPNYFRLYEKIAGMTATAHTEADEFKRLYKLEVIRIPTNKPVIRKDLPDKFYKTEEEKFGAILNDIKECYSEGIPVLIGTRSVEKSEHLSEMLKQNNIPHNVLNAKNHSEEAEIIKNAGQPYSVTIATNMAGRGTDIILGKDVKLGLYVIGTERHTTRRIDDQLIGRSGRQGDPGLSRFYLSLQDDLFRLFADDDKSQLVKAIENGQMTKIKALTRRAQRKSEETSYAMRKYLIEHDDVIDKQRRAIYKMREDILADNEVIKQLKSFIVDYVDSIVPTNPPYFSFSKIKDHIFQSLNVNISIRDFDNIEPESVKKFILDDFEKALVMREFAFGKDFFKKLTKAIMIEKLDTAWTDYLSYQSEFDNSIMLRSYVKENVIVDYRLESAKLFKDMLISLKYEILKSIFTYPLPDEKTDSVYRLNRQLSDQITKLL